MKKFFLYIARFLFLPMLMAVVGCASQDGSGSSDAAINESGRMSVTRESGSAEDDGNSSKGATAAEGGSPFVAVADFHDIRLPVPVDYLSGIAIDQDWLYLGTGHYNRELNQREMVVYRNGLMDAYDPEQYIAITDEPGMQFDLLALVPGSDGIFVYGQYGSKAESGLFTLNKYDNNGALLWSRDYMGEELEGEGTRLRDGAAADGSLFLYSSGKGGKIISFDGNGNIGELYTPHMDSLEGIAVTENGKAYGYGYISEKQFFVNLEDIAAPSASPVEFRKAFGGKGDEICLCNRKGLWGYNPETDETHLRWNWDDEYIQLVGDNAEYLCYANDVYYIMNRIQAAGADYMQPSWRPGQTVTFAEISFRDKADYPGKEIITLARFNSMSRYALDSSETGSGAVSAGISTWTEDLIRIYNRQSKKYYIKIVNEGEGLKASEKLNRVEMQILRGEGPDLLEVSGVFAPYMVEKGMLEDLTEYYEASDIVSPEDLLSQIQAGCTFDGKNVLVIPSFSLDTWISKEAVPLKEWTLWKFIGMCQERQMFYLSEPYHMFSECVRADVLGRFVDYETKECCFDSADFIRLLEECKKVPAKEVPRFVDYIDEADYLLQERTLTSMQDYLMVESSYGSNAAYQGMPGWEGAKHYISVYDVFAMNKTSANKEGAWDFLEFLLSEELQNSIEWGFPTRKDSFERYLELSYVHEEYNDLRFMYGIGAAVLPEEEDLAALREMVASSVYISGNARDAVGNIVYEEVAMFFNGGADLEQTIEKIQNRVSLYLKEM